MQDFKQDTEKARSQNYWLVIPNTILQFEQGNSGQLNYLLLLCIIYILNLLKEC